jgi:hypothetical protein
MKGRKLSFQVSVPSRSKTVTQLMGRGIGIASGG